MLMACLGRNQNKTSVAFGSCGREFLNRQTYRSRHTLPRPDAHDWLIFLHKLGEKVKRTTLLALKILEAQEHCSLVETVTYIQTLGVSDLMIGERQETPGARLGRLGTGGHRGEVETTKTDHQPKSKQESRSDKKENERKRQGTNGEQTKGGAGEQKKRQGHKQKE